MGISFGGKHRGFAPSSQWTTAEADRDNSSPNFSVQAQRVAQILALQHAAKPRDLIRRLEKRVIAVDLHVLSLDDILDLADRFRRDIADALKVVWNKHE